MLNESKILLPLYKVGQGKRTDLLTCDLQITSGKTRDLVGASVGVSGSQIQKLLYIEKPLSSLIDYIDAGEITVQQAYTQARQSGLPPKTRPMPVPANDPAGKSCSVITGDCEKVLPSFWFPRSVVFNRVCSSLISFFWGG